jgi:hypothetical protein
MSDEGDPDAAWRPLTDQERGLLEALLVQDFPGSQNLMAQVEAADAQRGCECGCGTINLRVNESLAPEVVLTGSLAPGEAAVMSETGEEVGGLIVFVRKGYLSCLEIYTFGDPAPLPPLDRIRPYVADGRAPGTEA